MKYRFTKPCLSDRIYDIISETGGFDCYDEIIRILLEYATARMKEDYDDNSGCERQSYKRFVTALETCLDEAKNFQAVID